MGESGSTKGIYWYFQRVIMMKPTLKKQHREGGGGGKGGERGGGGGGGGEQWEKAGVLRDIVVFQEGYHDETNIKETTHIYQ